jgi:hypothetical protein
MRNAGDKVFGQDAGESTAGAIASARNILPTTTLHQILFMEDTPALRVKEFIKRTLQWYVSIMSIESQTSVELVAMARMPKSRRTQLLISRILVM